MENKKIKLSSIQEGEWLSYTTYVKVVNKDRDSINVQQLNGSMMGVRGKDLVESFNSAGQFTETQKASKNEMVEVLKQARDKVVTVIFTKQNGEERTMICHVIGFETNLGRTNVIDLEIDPADKTEGRRLIDNRTIQMVICDGIKYIAQ